MAGNAADPLAFQENAILLESPETIDPAQRTAAYYMHQCLAPVARLH